MVLQSKSGVEESRRLMAGHLPAVKAGGKRVKVKKSSEDPRVTPEKGAKRTEKPRSLPSFKGPHHVGLLLSGTLGKLWHDFPETPVSMRHGKVRPAVEKLHVLRTFSLQQPRKCCS